MQAAPQSTKLGWTLLSHNRIPLNPGRSGLTRLGANTLLEWRLWAITGAAKARDIQVLFLPGARLPPGTILPPNFWLLFPGAQIHTMGHSWTIMRSRDGAFACALRWFLNWQGVLATMFFWAGEGRSKFSSLWVLCCARWWAWHMVLDHKDFPRSQKEVPWLFHSFSRRC